MVVSRLIIRPGSCTLSWGTGQLIKKCPRFQIYPWSLLNVFGSPRGIFVLKQPVIDIMFHYTLSAARAERKWNMCCGLFCGRLSILYYIVSSGDV
jgi:hypothetical protein